MEGRRRPWNEDRSRFSPNMTAVSSTSSPEGPLGHLLAVKATLPCLDPRIQPSPGALRHQGCLGRNNQVQSRRCSAHPHTGSASPLPLLLGAPTRCRPSLSLLRGADLSAEPAPKAGEAAGEVPEPVTPETPPAGCSVLLHPGLPQWPLPCACFKTKGGALQCGLRGPHSREGDPAEDGGRAAAAWGQNRGLSRGCSAPCCPCRGGVQRTRVSRPAGRRDARLRGRGRARARGSAWAGIWGPRRAGAASTRRRGSSGWPGCGSFLEPLARLFPRIVGATHGRGARARARHSRGRSSPRLGDAGLEDPGGRGPPSRSLPRARAKGAGRGGRVWGGERLSCRRPAVFPEGSTVTSTRVGLSPSLHSCTNQKIRWVSHYPEY